MKSYDPSGDLIRERLQQGWVTYPGGVTYPRLSVLAKYKSGVLSGAAIAVILEAVFNEDVPAEVFRVSLPKKATLIDYRSGTPTARRLKEGGDVATAASQGVRTFAPAAQGVARRVRRDLRGCSLLSRPLCY